MQNTLEISEHKGKAFIISVLLYIAFLAALHFITIAYEPMEEPMAMGVDLNYGVDLAGSGDIQTLNKANASKNNYDVKPEESPEKKASANPPVEKSKPEPKAAAKTPPVITADEDTKVVMKKTTDKAVKISPKTNIETNKTKATSSKPAPTTPKPVARTADAGSIFKKPGASSGSNGTVGTRSGVGGNNNGNGKNGEIGYQGSNKGTLDGKSLYGSPGGGNGKGGTSVSISGWKNRGPLNIAKDNSNETGRIKFRVVVDDYGDVVKIDLIEGGVSPSIINYYKNQIIKKLKSNLIPDGNPPPRSTGTITINITRG